MLAFPGFILLCFHMCTYMHTHTCMYVCMHIHVHAMLRGRNLVLFLSQPGLVLLASGQARVPLRVPGQIPWVLLRQAESSAGQDRLRSHRGEHSLRILPPWSKVVQHQKMSIMLYGFTRSTHQPFCESLKAGKTWLVLALDLWTERGKGLGTLVHEEGPRGRRRREGQAATTVLVEPPQRSLLI